MEGMSGQVDIASCDVCVWGGVVNLCGKCTSSNDCV